MAVDPSGARHESSGTRFSLGYREGLLRHIPKLYTDNHVVVVLVDNTLVASAAGLHIGLRLTDTVNRTMSDSEVDVVVFPTDGISKDFYVDRQAALQELFNKTRRHGHVVLGAPPATGKTSLLMMLKWHIKQRGARVIKKTLLKGERVEEVISWLESDLEETWILLDDSHNMYGTENEPLWQFIIKGIQAAEVKEKLFVVIASTYDLSTGDSPVVFRNLEHLAPFFNAEEVAEFFALFLTRMKIGENWDNYKRSLTHLSFIQGHGYHVGVIFQGVRLLDSMKKRAGRRSPPEESEAAQELRGPEFLLSLDRCFGLGMSSIFDADALKHTIADTLLSVDGNHVTIDGSLAPLVRAGILDNTGNFSCLAARWYYNQRCFPRRAVAAPESLDQLVIYTVGTMSAKRLQDTLEDGFPKEATFQHLFNEGMNMLLPLRNYLIPEFNTFALDSAGDPVHGELDFFINAEYRWCLELLRNGDKIGEHLSRFDPSIGKYRGVVPNDYLVVDCRGPKTRAVAENEARCTLYFAGDFKSCVCKMRTKDEITIHLEP